MKSICRKGAVTLVAALALCALTVASASASEWYVGGKALTGSEKLATTVKVEQPIVISIPNIKYEFTCTAASDAASEIAAKTTFKSAALTLESCKTTLPKSGCELERPEISFFKMEAVLTKGTSPEDKIKLQPQTKGGELGSIPFGSACGLGPSQPMYGAVTLNMVKGQEENAEQTFEGQGTKESPSELKTFSRTTGASTYVTGKLKLKLASGKTWSFH